MARVGAQVPRLSASDVLSRVGQLRSTLRAHPSVADGLVLRQWKEDLLEAHRLAGTVPRGHRDVVPPVPAFWRRALSWLSQTPPDPLLRASELVHGVRAELAGFGVHVQFGGAARAAGLTPAGDPFSPEGTQSLVVLPQAPQAPLGFAQRVRVEHPADSAPGHYEYRVNCAGIREPVRFEIRRVHGNAGGHVDEHGTHVLNIDSQLVSRRHATVAFDPHTRQLTVTDHDSTNGTHLPGKDESGTALHIYARTSFSTWLPDGETSITIWVGNSTVPVILENIPARAVGVGAEPSPREFTEVLDRGSPRPAAPILSADELFASIRDHFPDHNVADRIMPTSTDHGNNVLFILTGHGLQGGLTVKIRRELEVRLAERLGWVFRHIAPLHASGGDAIVDSVRVEFVARDTLAEWKAQVPTVFQSGIVSVQQDGTRTGALNRDGIFGTLRSDMRKVTLVLTVLEDDPRCLAACVAKARGLSADSQITPVLRRIFPSPT